MGKVINTADMKRVVDANVRAYVEQVTGSFSRLFGRSPTFVTYYSQDLARGGADVNLGGVIEILGPESPLRFRAVHDFPVYGISEADVSQAYDDVQGVVAANVGGEAHILPGTIEPMENDLFVIQHLETQLVFRVKAADADRIEGKAYFKLQYFLDHLSPEDIGRQVTGEYAFELANVGTEHTPLVEMDTALILRETEELAERLRLAYWRAFYDRSSGTLVLRDGVPSPVHDRAVDRLVSRHDLLSGRGYLGSRTVRPVEYGDRGMFDDSLYPLTVYAQLEAGRWEPTPETSNRVLLAETRPGSPSSPFFADFAVDGIREAMLAPMSMPGGMFCGGEDLIPRTTAGNHDGVRPLRSLAGRVLGGAFVPGDRDRLRAFTDALNDGGLMTDRQDAFWLVPIVLFEAARLAGRLQRTTD